MACEDLVAGCFAGERAPFGLHQNDAEQATAYLTCCVKAQLTWEQVEQQLRTYLATKGTSEAFQQWVDEQIAQAQRMMLPWLEHHRTLSSTVVNIRDE